MKKLITFLIAGIIILSSCINPDRYAPRPVEKSIQILSVKEKALPTNVEIPLFYEEEQNIPQYHKIAFIQVIGDDWFSEEQLINNLKYEAHKLGANALINVEFGEQVFAVEKVRVLEDTLYDNVEYRRRRRKSNRQYMRGLAVVMDSTALPESNDTIASHITYVRQERDNRWRAEDRANKNRMINFGIICSGIIVGILTSTGGD